jgi:hypothetical protein
MKKIFRFFRGELNGFFLYRLVTFLNHYLLDVFDELIYQTLFQWKTEEEINAGELAVREEDIYSIAKVAGLFDLRVYGETTLQSIDFVPSNIVNGVQRSERALRDMVFEFFVFIRTEHDDYSDDIVNEASERRRMTLVPSGTTPVGYAYYGESIYTNEGDIIWAKVHPAPPEDGRPYSEFYGAKFLVFRELFASDLDISTDVFKLLLESLMRVRYSGLSVISLLEITEYIGEGFIYDLQLILQAGRYLLCTYKVNMSAFVTYKTARLAIWRHICALKFKLVVLMQVEET